MKTKVLLNAIIGDMCGSIYEWKSTKKKPENLIDPRCDFTDDTVHTIAVADAIMKNPENPDFASSLRVWSLKYPYAGYGGMMRKWIHDPNMGPYGSFGNGSAMRVSACGWVQSLCDNALDESKSLLHRDPKELKLAIKSAEVTHNHPEGIKGSQSICDIMSMLRALSNLYTTTYGHLIKNSAIYKPYIYIVSNKYYSDYYPLINNDNNEYIPDVNKYIKLDQRRPSYGFDATCQGSVPQSIQCVLEAESYEDAIKLAISMGGDTDTMACIAGSIAGVIWDKPDELVDFAYKRLPNEMIKVIEDFDKFINIE